MKQWIGIVALCALPLQAANIAIVGGKVHTMTQQGSLDSATVLIKDGKIEQVVEGEQKPAGYQLIDAKGKVVTPGLIGAYTQLGLVEVGSSAGTVDSSASKTSISKTGAALDVRYGINPDSTLLPISRLGGITSAATGLSHTAGMFKGQGAIISLGDKVQPLLKERAFISLAVDNGGANAVGGTRAALWVALNNALDEASYAKGKELSPQSEWHGELSRADVKALIPVINGNIPLLIRAHRAADIRQVIALGSRIPELNIVLLGAAEGWRVANELAAANIPVILDPQANLPSSFDRLGSTMQNAARLHRAGVRVAIGMDTHNIRLARQYAGNAVSQGLPWQAGLAALTSHVAAIYGLEERLGVIKAGVPADVVVWSGDPLEVTEAAERVMIKGKLMPMESRQTKLRDRYLQRMQNKVEKPAPYIRP